MAQTIWKGWLSFGLVTIPVRLHRAVEQKTVRFREMDVGTGRRVRHRRMVEESEESPAPPMAARRDGRGDDHPGGEQPPAPREREIPYERVVKGFELPSGEMVTVTREELWAIEPQQTRTIEIVEFVNLSHVDPVYFDRSYYLVPQAEPGARRAYGLLLRAMEETGRVALGTFVLRTREHLAAVRPMQGALGLVTLHYGDEIRSAADVGYVPEGPEPPQREVKLANQLIEALAREWDPTRHRDAYRARVLQLIEEKAASGAVVSVPEERGAATEVTVDLMAALKASVEAIGQSQGKKRQSRRRTG